MNFWVEKPMIIKADSLSAWCQDIEDRLKAVEDKIFRMEDDGK